MKNILVYVEAAEGKAKNVGLEILTPAKVAADGGEDVYKRQSSERSLRKAPSDVLPSEVKQKTFSKT